VTETLVMDNLFASGPTRPDAQAIVILAGAGSYERGYALGKIAEGADAGKYKLADSTAVDGTENVDCILGESVDATGIVDVVSAGYFTGDFNSLALTFGGTDTVADHVDVMRAKGMFVKDNVPA
jgi:Bacteriophage lambda head decoration protein D